MNRLLAVAAVIEAITGLVLLINPSFVTSLLLGNVMSGAGVAVGRVAGIALIALGLACWPKSSVGNVAVAGCRAMVMCNLLMSIYLSYIGIRGQWVGVLLWPAVTIHGLLTLLLVRSWFMMKQTQDLASQQ